MKVRIFKANGAHGCEFCYPIDQADFETVTLLCNGQPRLGEWTPLRFQCVREDEGNRLRQCDSPWYGSHVLIMRESVVSGLGDLLNEHGELLPLEVAGEKLWLFNATRVIDCLDHEQTQLTRFSSSGRVMCIDRHVFLPDALDGSMVFKLPELPRACPLYFTQDFVAAWKRAGLTGLDFDIVWSDK